MKCGEVKCGVMWRGVVPTVLPMQVFQRARAAAPSIIFFDEVDALAVHRKK